MNDDDPPEEITPAVNEATPPYMQCYNKLYWFQPDRGVYVRADVLGKRSREHVERVTADRAARRRATPGLTKRLL